MSSVATAAAATRFSGSLSDVALADVLQTVAASPSGGTIEIDGDWGTGTIIVVGGQVVDATLADYRGEAALRRILLDDRGTFRAQFGAVAQTTPLSMPPHVALMRAATLQDEWRRTAPESVAPGARLVLVPEHVDAWRDGLGDGDHQRLARFDGATALFDILDDDPDGLEIALTRMSGWHRRGLLQPANAMVVADLPVSIEARSRALVSAYAKWTESSPRAALQSGAAAIFWLAWAMAAVRLDPWWCLAGMALAYAIPAGLVAADPRGLAQATTRRALIAWPVLEIMRRFDTLAVPRRLAAAESRANDRQ